MIQMTTKLLVWLLSVAALQQSTNKASPEANSPLTLALQHPNPKTLGSIYLYCSVGCPLTKGWCGWWPGTSRRACLGPGGCTPRGFGWCPGPACCGSPQTCPGRVCHCSHSPLWWSLLHCTWQGSNAWLKWPRNQRSRIDGDGISPL